ncbi:MAG: hypothetical protein GX777_01960 [Fastidiosipila sp.]|nr:hypothetical protein [Fastidiosipila sp.]
MKLKVKGKEQELKFNMGFIRRLDEIHSIKVDVMGAGDGMAFGVGLVYADIQLKQYSPVMLSDVIRAATNCSIIDADKAIEDYAEENGSLDKLFDGVIDGLKKSPVVKTTLMKMVG